MRKTFLQLAWVFPLLLGSSYTPVLAAEPGAKIRDIPGITAKDPFPSACVDCHRNHPERNADYRLSTVLKKWTDNVEPKYVAQAQAVAPAGLSLKGKHPAVDSTFKNIPSGCMGCHAKTSKTAPAFSRLLHVIHLTGGKDNHFITVYNGECANCHKMNTSTGEWTVPSGAER